MAGGGDSEPCQENEARLLEKYRVAFEQARDAIKFLGSNGYRDGNPATLTMLEVPDVASFATLHPGELSPPYRPGRPA